MALTIMYLVVRFMRAASSEALGDKIPVMKNIHVGTVIALVFTRGIDLASAIPADLGDVRRSQSINGLPCPAAGNPVVEEQRQELPMDILAVRIYVHHHHRCTAV